MTRFRNQARRKSSRFSTAAGAAVLSTLMRKAKRSRRVHSRTKTKTQKDPDDTAEVHSGISGANLRYSLGRAYSKQCFGTSMVLIENSQFFGVNQIGKQRCADIWVANTANQCLLGDAESVAGDTLYGEGAVGLLDMQPNSGQTGGSYFQPDPVPNHDRIFVSNVSFIMDISNLSSASCILDIYFLQCLQNTNKSPFQTFSDELLTLNGNKAANTYPPAGSITCQAGALDVSFVGARPGKIFKQTWKILGVHNILMGGSTAEHLVVNINTNYMVDRSKILNANNLAADDKTIIQAEISRNYLQGGTIACMAIWRGQSVIADFAADYATWAQTQLAFSMMKKTTLRPVEASAGRIGVAIGHSGLPTAGPLKFVNTEDAAVAPVIAL